MILAYVLTTILCLSALYVLMGGKLPGQRDRENFQAALNKLNEVIKDNGRLEEMARSRGEYLEKFFKMPVQAHVSQEQWNQLLTVVRDVVGAATDPKKVN